MIFTKVQVSLLVFFAFVDLLWIKLGSFSVYYDLQTLLVQGVFSFLFLCTYLFYKIFRPEPRMVALLQSALFLFSYSFIMVVFSYLMATLNHPLVDATLANMDEYLGISFVAIVSWFRDHFLWQVVFFLIYHTYMFQFLLIIVYFSFRNDTVPLQRFILQFMIAAPLTIIISGLFPAEAPYAWYYHVAEGEVAETLYQLRELRQNILDLSVLHGIIAAPSFHAVMAFFYVYAFRNQSKSIFISMAILNLLMMFSCIPIGGHYFVDILAALPVFLITLGVESLIFRAALSYQKPKIIWQEALPTPYDENS